MLGVKSFGVVSTGDLMLQCCMTFPKCGAPMDQLLVTSVCSRDCHLPKRPVLSSGQYLSSDQALQALLAHQPLQHRGLLYIMWFSPGLRWWAGLIEVNGVVSWQDKTPRSPIKNCAALQEMHRELQRWWWAFHQWSEWQVWWGDRP